MNEIKDFTKYRENIVGYGSEITTPEGKKQMVYADWTASGREYLPIEKCLLEEIAPFIGNTHTETSFTGSLMTKAYNEAKKNIKRHVNAGENDCLLLCGSGMTDSINKLQRILGFRYPERVKAFTKRKNPLIQFLSGIKIPKHNKPVIFITHMEHHSNQTSWLETIADVVIVEQDSEGLVSIENFRKAITNYSDRKIKIASITACSNVTGIQTPYHQIAEVIHEAGGYCIVDFACSAPYVKIDMHPKEKNRHLDAICFSPHKFLGGPATPGVLIFNKDLYLNKVPDNVGGGTVTFTDPWKFHSFIANIEEREDGGTPPFMQTIKAAMAIKLKEKIGIENMIGREHQIVEKVFSKLEKIENLHILAPNIKNRLSVFSFVIDNLHYNLAVKLLNDKFGIQTRGGCACAGTYGHILLGLDKNDSNSIYKSILKNDNSNKPGWIRMSIHPVMSDEEIDYILSSIESVCINYEEWAKDYTYQIKQNQFYHKTSNCQSIQEKMVEDWFG